MRPRRDDEALVDLIDVLLRDGVLLRADVVVTVAEVPLVGIRLSAAIAGMETMTDYGMLRAWDEQTRRAMANRRRPRAKRETGSHGEDVEDAVTLADETDPSDDVKSTDETGRSEGTDRC